MKVFRSRIRSIARLTFISFIVNIFYPVYTYALTGGPSQPEVQGFVPASSDNLVDVFTGDFSYSIPLMDVGGYPVNLSYSSGISMDQEASWVGLGWNLSPGAINRSVRGIPDDFKGENIDRSANMKTQRSYGANISAGAEAFGFLNIGAGMGVTYNNYTGYDASFSFNPSLAFAASSSSSLNVGLGVTSSAKGGVSITPTVSFGKKFKDKNSQDQNMSIGLSFPYNTRTGLQEISYQASYTASTKHEKLTRGADNNLKRETTYKQHSGEVGSSISFVKPTYVPGIDFPTFTAGFSIAPKIGGELFGVMPNVGVSGFYNQTGYLDRTKSTPAYGYLYEHEQQFGISTTDFNRENEGSYSPNRPALPLASHTFDIYSVSGQGISGTFRPYRHDIGIAYDPEISAVGSVEADISGLELGLGNAVEGGLNVTVSGTYSHSGIWNNSLVNYYRNYGFLGGYDEPAFFSQPGEKGADDQTLYNLMGGSEPLKPKHHTFATSTPVTYNQLEKANGGVMGVPNQAHVRTKRKPRNMVWQSLTGLQASQYGFDRTINTYNSTSALNAGTGMFTPVPSSRVDGTKMPHHLSEISILSGDGSRHYYGIPVYNTQKKEATFAVANSNTVDATKGTVTYTGSGINSDMAGGQDNYYQETNVPPHAYSYLLTNIVSSDYVDRTQNGPSPDDFGNWTKFNYNKTSGSYEWRAPYGRNKASYNRGSLVYDKGSNTSDDRGSVSYGKKEIYHVHSIETKTHTAIFSISPRNDAFGVNGENGGLSTAPNNQQYKLDKIELFTREDLIRQANDPSFIAVPIKTAHLIYDYSLCNQVENNKLSAGTGFNLRTGKLTLKQVYFTYYNSTKGSKTAYTFNYNSSKVSNNNPAYDASASDRWGNFKPNGLDNTTNSEFPYTSQNKSLTNDFASAWNLKEIVLPSGGSLKIEYESDDYAYVQHKAAMQMFKVAGTGSGLSDNLTSNKLYIEVPSGTTAQQFRSNYLKDLLGGGTRMFFKFLIELKDGYKDYVNGYAYVEGGDVELKDGKTYGVISLKRVGPEFLGGGAAHNPVRKAGVQSLQCNYPEVYYNNIGGDPNGKSVISAVKAVGNAMIVMMASPFYLGASMKLFSDGNANTFEKEKSFIRLYNPDGKKLGGGSRVKSIISTDAWQSMTGGANSEYITDYKYEVTENVGGVDMPISSGVAAYEPTLGGEENPWKQPIYTDEDRLLMPNREGYVEEPFGESFFPGPTVGYSYVSVSTRVPNNAKVHGTGKVVHKFYTARDYPTTVRYTAPSPIRKNSKTGLGNILKFYSYDRMSVSQGFSIELNDMHGKQKSQEIYNEAGGLVSSVLYKYKQNSDGSLNNTCLAISPAGTISNQTMGLEFDAMADFRQSYNSNTGVGVNGNLNGFLVALFPAAVPSAFPKFNFEETEFCSATITKVINKYAILDETIASQDGSVISTKNLLYDSETGGVLLTETSNEYSDPLYNFTYPAHWTYDALGLAYKTVGASSANGLTEADEVILSDGSKAWAKTSSSLIKADGSAASGSGVIVRSGRKNMQMQPVGTVVTKENPLTDTDGDGKADKLEFKKVLNASATEYAQDWKVFCKCGVNPDLTTNNPYLTGQRGLWRPVKSYAFLANRTQNLRNENLSVRNDGLFSYFNPFWNLNAGKWNKTTSTGTATSGKATEWQYTTEITNYSPYGFELENKDALNRYSAAYYGYQNTLPKAIAQNSEYKETAYDGMEDYENDPCIDNDHFSYIADKDKLVTTEAHTGRKSIKVPANGKVEVKKTIVVCPGNVSTPNPNGGN